MQMRLPKRVCLATCAVLIGQIAFARPFLTLTQGSERIEVEIFRTKAVARAKPSGLRYQVNTPLAQLLRRAHAAEQVLALEQDGMRYFVLLTREMSRPRAMGRGYCGAGEEHKLVLVAADRAKILSTRDELLV